MPTFIPLGGIPTPGPITYDGPTSIVGITGTKSQFSTAVTDGNILYDGDVTGKTSVTLTTGVLTGGVVSVNADPLKFDVSAGTGIIQDFTDIANPVMRSVSWPSFTAQSIPDISKPFTTVSIDVNGGLLVSSNFSPAITPRSRRITIVLSLLLHSSGTQIDRTVNVVKPAHEVSEAILDYIYQLGVVNSGNGASADGANLQIDKGSGTTTSPFINYFSDTTSPTIRTNSAASAVSFTYNYRNGSGGFIVTPSTNSVSPSLYDNGTGTLAAVASNRYTIQRIYYFSQTDVYGIFYGQALYNSLSIAESSIATEAPILNPVVVNGTFVTALVVKGGTTALNNTDNAVFRAITNSANIASGAVSLQSAYSASSNPEITTDSTRGAFSLVEGTGVDSASVLEVLNNARALTFSLSGNGTLRSTSKTKVTTNNLTTTTLSSSNTYFTGTAGASFAITLPAASLSIDGAIFVVMSTTARTATTWLSTGATFVGVPSALLANTPVAVQYHNATSEWFITH
jgi:hypothetical protein